MKLTENEFETLIEALENLPSKGDAGRLLSRLVAHSFCRDNEEDKQKLDTEIAKQELKEEEKKKELKKQTGIIVGKLYMMKDDIVEE